MYVPDYAIVEGLDLGTGDEAMRELPDILGHLIALSGPSDAFGFIKKKRTQAATRTAIGESVNEEHKQIKQCLC